MRVEMIFAIAPADALQALAGGLLLKHGERDELTHAGDFGMKRGDFVVVFGCGAIADVRPGEDADEQQSGAPSERAERRAKPLEEIPGRLCDGWARHTDVCGR